MIDPVQILRFRNVNPVVVDAMKAAYSPTETQQTGESGKAMGYALKVISDPGQSLMDSMEELAMSFEEKKINDMGQRKIGEMRGKSSILSAAIDKWMKTLPDMPDEARLARLMRHVRTLLARGGTPEDLLKMLGDESGDAAHQYAMLDILESAQGADAQTVALVRAAKALLERSRGAEMRAGLNLAEIVNARSADVGEIRNLRELYRGEVLGFKSPQACFRSLLAQRGPEGLRLSIDFLVEACGVDIQCASPSKSEEELSRILGDLQCVDVLVTVMERTEVLSRKMLSQFGERCRLDGAGLMERILVLTEVPFVDPGRIAELVRQTGVSQLLAQLYFTTSLLGLFRALSPRLFADEEARQRMLDAGQEHLDGLVARQQTEDEKEGAA